MNRKPHDKILFPIFLGNYILGINGYRSIQYHAYLGLLKVRSEVNVS